MATKSTAQLVSETLDDTTQLLRKEAELLKIGVTEAVMGRLKGAGLIALAVAAVLPGLLFVIVGLTIWLPFSSQVDFVLVGLLLLGAGAAAITIGMKLVKSGGGESTEAFDHLKEDARWARERLTP